MQNPSVPQGVDDTTVMPSPPGMPVANTPTPGSVPPEPPQETTVVSPTSSGNPKRKFPVAAIFGIVLLVLGVGAGLLLVSQSQIFHEKAACQSSNNGTTMILCPGTYSISKWTCPNALDPVSGKCFCSSGHGTATSSVLIVDQNLYPNGQPFNASDVASVQCGSGQWDVNSGDVTGGQGVNGGGICYSSGTDCGGGGGGVGPTATPVPTATPQPICGGTCTTDVDCAPSSGGNVHPVCDPTTKTCQNPNCIGYTTPGTICSCGPAPSALPCGALCGGQNDGQVFPTNCLNGTCGNNANGGTSGNRCLQGSNGYTVKGGSCVQDKNPAVFCLFKPDGSPALTASDVLAACAPPAPPMVCLNVTKDIVSPQLGQNVTFTCGSVVGATRYDFIYRINGGKTSVLTPSASGSNVAAPLAITQGGTYEVQCRPCNTTTCTPWQTSWTDNPGLVSEWTFDETAGSVAVDTVGINDGAATGTTVATAGKSNNARSFAGGATDTVNTGTSGTNPTNATWITWIKKTDTSYGGVYTSSGNMADHSFRIYIDTTGHLVAGIGWVKDNTYAANIQPNVWYNVAVTKSASNWVMYLNGTQVLTWTDSTPIVIGTAHIGQSTSGAVWFSLNGTIDNTRIYGQALTATDILNYYNATK